MPLWWEMAYYCLNLQSGTVRHFPSGTYHEQAATREGKQELSAMETTWQAWRTFKTPPSKWTDSDRRVASLAMDDVPPPSHRLDWIIAALWQSSLWARVIMRHLRGMNG